MGKRRRLASLLAGTFLIAGASGGAHAEIRSLNLINTNTQERANVVFKRDGVYDQDGLQELNRLLRDWRRNEVTRMDPALFDLIWEVYRDTGAHDPIHIVCGYRSPATNNALRSRSRGVAKFSQHMLGKAMDFYLPDVNLATLRETGMKKQVGGVGFYPTSGSPFVHMDTGSVRAWPRMSREQLVRLFPDGKTAHLPADGSPLPGYQTALVESEARKAKGGGPVERSSSGGGLLAALFGGSSSSAPARAVAGEDEEESAAPAPRRAQELRQGPLPGASSPKLLARNDTPPGVPDFSQPGAKTDRKLPQQQLALAQTPPPPVAAPVPTVTAAGSLVALPVARAPQVQAAAANAPSRYGPSNGELPPGWVSGPSGHPAATPVADEESAPEARSLAHLDVPLPRARPGGTPAVAMTLASLAAGQGMPIAVSLPRPRPTGPMKVASLAPTDVLRGGPDAAIAALTGDREEAPTYLGYAAASDTQLAMPTPAPAVEQAPRADLRAPAQPARSTPSYGKQDRFTDPLTRLVAKSDRGGPTRLYDSAGRTESREFAQLKHPDQASLDGLLSKPGVALAVGFTTASLDRLAGARFSGPAIVPMAIIRTQ